MNGDVQLTSAPEAPRQIGQDEKRLRKFIGRQRDRYESKLLATVKQQGPKLTRDIEALLDALHPGEDVEAPSAAMLAEIQQRFTRLANANATGEEHLHELRKAAKRARYQSESLPGPDAEATAKQFEDLHDAGGEWHDLLELAVRAHDRFGPDHPLCRVLEHRRDQRLDHYAELLGQFRDTHPAPPRETHRKPRKRAAPHRATKAAKKSTAKSTARKSVKRARAQ
jgi:CHAD domain-containing protein